MSASYLKNKEIIKNFNEKIHGASIETIDNIIKDYYHEGLCWNGPQPFNKLEGREELLEKFWKPFLKAFPDVQKDVYFHFAGSDPMHQSEKEWVVTSGNFVGTFESDWLDIPATKGSVWIRYVEFNRIEDDKIKETFTLIDILDLMRQAGFTYINSLAPEIIIPGPATNDGVVMEDCDELQSNNTRQLIYNMLTKGLSSFKDVGLGNMGSERYFDKDFMWYGPCGIGSTRGIKGFEEYHQNPFLKSLPDRGQSKTNSDRTIFAEGKYCALFTWATFTATHTVSEWLGMPATNKHITMRCIDIYRTDGDKILENWVFLDMIDILLYMGIDVFELLRNKKYFAK